MILVSSRWCCLGRSMRFYCTFTLFKYLQPSSTSIRRHLLDISCWHQTAHLRTYWPPQKNLVEMQSSRLLSSTFVGSQCFGALFRTPAFLSEISSITDVDCIQMGVPGRIFPSSCTTKGNCYGKCNELAMELLIEFLRTQDCRWVCVLA